MSGTRNQNTPPRKEGEWPEKPSTAPVKRDDSQADDAEDGDIATPKQDHTGEDDQPL